MEICFETFIASETDLSSVADGTTTDRPKFVANIQAKHNQNTAGRNCNCTPTKDQTILRRQII